MSKLLLLVALSGALVAGEREIRRRIAAGDREGAKAALLAQASAAKNTQLAQDTWFRIALLDLDPDPRRARDDADHGLALGRATDLFTANLLIVHARACELTGDDAAAVRDYQDALRINETLLGALEAKR